MKLRTFSILCLLGSLSSCNILMPPLPKKGPSVEEQRRIAERDRADMIHEKEVNQAAAEKKKIEKKKADAKRIAEKKNAAVENRRKLGEINQSSEAIPRDPAESNDSRDSLRDGLKPDVPVKKVSYPTASAVVGKEGMVLSPYNNRVIDVRGLPSGSLVRDPTYDAADKKFFRVP